MTIQLLKSLTREAFVYSVLKPDATDGILSLMAVNVVDLCQLTQSFTLIIVVVHIISISILISFKVSVRISLGARFGLNSG